MRKFSYVLFSNQVKNTSEIFEEKVKTYYVISKSPHRFFYVVVNFLVRILPFHAFHLKGKEIVLNHKIQEEAQNPFHPFSHTHGLPNNNVLPLYQ